MLLFKCRNCFSLESINIQFGSEETEAVTKSSARSQASSSFVSPLIGSPGSRAGLAMCARGRRSVRPPSSQGTETGPAVAPTGCLSEGQLASQVT